MQMLVAWMTLLLAGQVAQNDRYSDAAAPPAAAPVSAETSAAAEGNSPAATASATGDEFFNNDAPSGNPSAPLANQGGVDAQENPPGTAPPATDAAHAEPPREQVPLAAGAPDMALPEASVLVQGPKPSDLMRQLLQAPGTGQLAGTPISLSDVVRASRSRQDQTERAKAYWNLSAAAANYYLALLEQTELTVLRQGIAVPSKLWDQRLVESRSRIESTHRAAVAAQLRLQQLVGGAGAATLPLPADAPHCGRYNAEYEEIFAAKPDPIARQLSELLPLRYVQLRAESQAVADAIAWRDRVSRHRDPQGDGVDLLSAQDLLSLQRRNFIATAQAYNIEIAAYTELAAPNEVAPDRVVAMMIRTSTGGATAPWSDGEVRQAAAVDNETAAREDGNGGSGDWRTTQTFADPDRTEVRRPLRRMFEREHSIVSTIKRLRDRQE